MQGCLSGLPAETDLPTNVGVRITRRGANAGEATVTKVVFLHSPLALTVHSISLKSCMLLILGSSNCRMSPMHVICLVCGVLT